MTATRRFDFRKSTEGLTALVRDQTAADPFSGQPVPDRPEGAMGRVDRSVAIAIPVPTDDHSPVPKSIPVPIVMPLAAVPPVAIPIMSHNNGAILSARGCRRGN